MPYRSSVISCLDDKGICCDVLLCGPCNVGRQWNASKRIPESPNCPICFLSMLGPVGIIIICQIRVSMNNTYALDEGTCGSCLAALFCPPCAVCQQSREFIAQGTSTGHVCCTPSQTMN